MREFKRAAVQPFKKGDIIRQYHHTDLFDDFLVVFSHANGALDVVRHGVSHGLSARFSELSPNQDTTVGDSKKKRMAIKIHDFILNVLDKSLT